MIPNCVIKESEKVGAKYKYTKGVLQGVKPAETMFGYTYFAHAIPPFKPEHTLILGYGNGTVAELMRKVWGQCKITGVDLEPSDFDYNEYKLKVMDAKQFVWEATTPAFKDYLFTKDKYDYVYIDLWDGGQVCDFVFDVEFAVRLKEIASKLVSMNILAEDVPKVKNYHDYAFKFDRSVPVGGNQVLWWSV